MSKDQRTFTWKHERSRGVLVDVEGTPKRRELPIQNSTLISIFKFFTGKWIKAQLLVASTRKGTEIRSGLGQSGHELSRTSIISRENVSTCGWDHPDVAVIGLAGSASSQTQA